MKCSIQLYQIILTYFGKAETDTETQDRALLVLSYIL